MVIRIPLKALLAASLALAVSVGATLTSMSTSAAAEEDIEMMADDFMAFIKKQNQDSELCRNKSGNVANDVMREACTRAIKSAPRENDMVAQFYVMRASVGVKHTDQCRDVRKGLAIIEKVKSRLIGQSFIDAARRLEKAACY